MLSVLNNFIYAEILVKGQRQQNKYKHRIMSKRLRKELAQKCIQSWITVDTFLFSDRQCEIKHKLK